MILGSQWGFQKQTEELQVRVLIKNVTLKNIRKISKTKGNKLKALRIKRK